jgi:hypothetical protein
VFRALMIAILLLAMPSIARADFIPGPGPSFPRPPPRPERPRPSPICPMDERTEKLGWFVVVFVAGGAVLTMVERRKRLQTS